MTPTPSFTRTAALLVTPLLFLAACGGESGSQDGNADPGEAQDAKIRPEVADLLAESLDGAAATSLPDSYSSTDRLTMATDATMGEPIAVINGDTSVIEGFTVDLAQALGYVLGKEIEVVNTPFDSFIPGLQAGRYDFSVSIMLDTPERQEQVDFVDYLIDGSSLLVAADSPHEGLTLDDLCGLRVGALRGSVEAGYLEEQNEKCAADDQVEINIFQGNNEMVLGVNSDRIDVLMGPASQLSYVESMANGQIRSGGEPIGQAVDGIAIGKDSGLTEPIHEALTILKEEGVYLDILALYGMEPNAVDEATINNPDAHE